MSSPQKTDPAVVAEIETALHFVRRGDLGGARAVAERALSLDREGGAVHALLGMLCCQAGDLAAGIPHLRTALRFHPDDSTVAGNLATALLQNNAPDEALSVCTADIAAHDGYGRIWRLRGYILQITEDYAGAADAYQHVVAIAPDDFEAWNNLGNARAAMGDVDASLAALERAASLRPDIAPIRLNVATTLLEAGRIDAAMTALEACARDFPRDAKPLIELAAVFKQLNRDAEALRALEQAALLEPRDADLQVKLGTERILAWEMDEAEASLRNAIAIDPAHAEAQVLLGVLLEHMNRPMELPELVANAEAAGVDDGSVQFVRALVYRRERRFEEGLAALAKVPDDVEPIRKAQLTGQFHDRLGDPKAAFAGFMEMNRLLAEDPSEPERRAARYRAALEHDRAAVTADWYRNWRPAVRAVGYPSPVFLVGFPRSGTTLLDTLLMGHPRVQVLEERPPINKVEEAAGGIARLAELGSDEVDALRELYFREAAACVDLLPDTLLVDKFPLHLNKVPIIHRLFPEARFILALRHPLDVVLSCFITNFRLNDAMANFTDLANIARVYDLSFGFWEQCRAIMPIRSHAVTYERIVENSEAELRPLFDFLELDWRGEVLDHRQTAADRGIISTASYAQVTEPIYNRAAGRWTHYREELEPVLPILRPWIEHFGYTL